MKERILKKKTWNESRKKRGYDHSEWLHSVRPCECTVVKLLQCRRQQAFHASFLLLMVQCMNTVCSFRIFFICFFVLFFVCFLFVFYF